MAASSSEPAPRVIDPEDVEGDDDIDADGKAERGNPNKWPKRKVALVFGYCGTGYQGLQLNPGARTIDGELISAMLKSGYALESNLQSLNKISWVRTARTDKGVHAAANVTSLKFMTPPGVDYETARQVLNSFLPPVIRIHGIIRTAGSFHAKRACSGRQYEYILPTFALNPLEFGEMKAEGCEDCTEAAGGDGGDDDDDDNGNARPKKQNRKNDGAEDGGSAAVALPVGGAGAEPVDAAGDVDTEAGTAAAPSSSAPAPVAAPTPAFDDYQTGAAYARGRAEAWAARAAYEKRNSRFSYRVPLDIVAKFREACKKYVGTHYFHNFSPRVNPADSSAQRFITGMDVSPPFVYNGVELLRVTIRGQSFLLNQIRHLIGLAVHVARGGLPLATMDDVMSRSYTCRVPLAPATGLFLHSAFFKTYNDKFGKDHEPLVFVEGELADRIREFKETYIWQHIVDQIRASGAFEHWLASELAGFTYRLNPFTAPSDAQVAKKQKMKEGKAAYLERIKRGRDD